MNLKFPFKHHLSSFSLLMTGLAATIGSGWLLGTQKLAEITGPASILAWVLGALIILLVALFYLEIGSAFPSAGGIGYYAHITHGRLCGFLTLWINWLSVTAVAPIEMQSIVQYVSQLQPSLLILYHPESHCLSGVGLMVAIALMLVMMFINYWSVKFFIHFNNIFTFIKIAIPLLTVAGLFYSGLHPQNFGHNLKEFMPYGPESLWVGIIGSGVVMSFNGFQTPLTFSEEIKNPRKMLPLAVIASILFALFLYILLQVAFVGKIDPALINQGWAQINFRSPYVTLLLIANLQILVTTLYIGAVVSPFVSANAFLASSARIMYAMAKEKHLPTFLSKIHAKHGTLRNTLLVNTAIGCIFILLFKGWYLLVGVISVLHVLSYLAAPVITIANRRQNKEHMRHKDQFSLKGAYILAPIVLFVLSILLFYAAWPLTGEVLLFIFPGLGFYFYYDYKYFRDEKFLTAFKGASWLIFYCIGIGIITFLGNNPHGNFIGKTTAMIFLATLALIIYLYGAFFAIPKK